MIVNILSNLVDTHRSNVILSRHRMFLQKDNIITKEHTDNMFILPNTLSGSVSVKQPRFVHIKDFSMAVTLTHCW